MVASAEQLLMYREFDNISITSWALLVGGVLTLVFPPIIIVFIAALTVHFLCSHPGGMNICCILGKMVLIPIQDLTNFKGGNVLPKAVWGPVCKTCGENYGERGKCSKAIGRKKYCVLKAA